MKTSLHLQQSIALIDQSMTILSIGPSHVVTSRKSKAGQSAGQSAG